MEQFYECPMSPDVMIKLAEEGWPNTYTFTKAIAEETSNRAFYSILSCLVHYIPAYTVDAVIKLFRLKTPKELKSFVHIYDKFNKMGKIFEFFLTNEWNFDETNLTGLWHRLSGTDRQIYNFEMKTIDWDWNTMMWGLGVRKYLIKDGLKNTNEAIEKQKWLKLANYAVVMLYIFIALYLIRLLFKLFM
ncbi:Uncharacterized protein OBRU01_14188, partial [Operophtera brumata]